MIFYILLHVVYKMLTIKTIRYEIIRHFSKVIWKLNLWFVIVRKSEGEIAHRHYFVWVTCIMLYMYTLHMGWMSICLMQKISVQYFTDGCCEGGKCSLMSISR